MRRRIIGVIISLLIAAAIAGCGRETQEHRMRLMDRTAAYDIYVDTDTGVCYLRGTSGGYCVMVDHNGNPYIANGWRDWSDGDDY